MRHLSTLGRIVVVILKQPVNSEPLSIQLTLTNLVDTHCVRLVLIDGSKVEVVHLEIVLAQLLAVDGCLSDVAKAALLAPSVRRRVHGGLQVNRYTKVRVVGVQAALEHVAPKLRYNR